jgi:hypothetical protein
MPNRTVAQTNNYKQNVTKTMPKRTVAPRNNSNQNVSYLNYLKRMRKTDIFLFFQYSSPQRCRCIQVQYQPFHRQQSICSVLWWLTSNSHIFSSAYSATRNKLTLVLVTIVLILVAALVAILGPVIALTNKSTGMVLSTKKSVRRLFLYMTYTEENSFTFI